MKITKQNLFDELNNRGLIKQGTDLEKIKKMLSQDNLVVYTGTDPTADSLHIGHCVPACIMRRFQMAGHKVIILVGGATAAIGDPTGRTEMRKMLSKEQLEKNIESIKKSYSKFLKFDGENPAIIVNNADWFSDYSYTDFMRDVGVHFNVNKMLTNDIYANRLQEGGLTFFEMGYMLMQAYDFLYLNKKYGCNLQWGGSDQWGNIVAGVELGRKMNFIDGKNREMEGITNPLLLTPEGKKMGKTEKGAIWIDETKISPYDFYQGIYQTPDACVEMMFALFTDEPMEKVRELIKTDIVKAKKILSYEITKFIQGEEKANQARQASEEVFAGSGKSENMNTVVYPKLEAGVNVCELVSEVGICSSRGEARRLIAQAGISIDGEKVSDDKLVVKATEVVVSKGKKIHLKVVSK
ncbi:MAG: tyrosine--tRNA ligase [Clostridia bacterium]|nr:tyrosine--tRNA ligase [Clostridia bacterium]